MNETTERRQIRLGYVGCGTMAQRVHIPNFASLADCQIVALAEVRAGIGERVQARHGIRRLYRDHRELIDDLEVDAVGVSAAQGLQSEIARDCLAAGKPVFMEKPMAISVAQAERLLEAARAGRTRLMVAYMKRYDPGNILVRDTTRAWRRTGEMGRIVLVRAHGFCGDWVAGIDLPLETAAEEKPPPPTAENLPAWLPAECADGYGNYVNQWTHNVNLLRFLLDAGDRGRVRTVDLDPEDKSSGVAVLDVDGVRCSLETGRLSYHRWDEHTQVYFEHGWVHTWAPPLLLRNAVAEVEIYRHDRAGAPGRLGEAGVQHTVTRAIPEPRWSWAYKNEAAHFVECLRSGAEFGSTGQDTLTDVRLIEEIYRTWLNR
jgi:predicted dehydrogenase